MKGGVDSALLLPDLECSSLCCARRRVSRVHVQGRVVQTMICNFGIRYSSGSSRARPRATA
jgi:hypothetical protein